MLFYEDQVFPVIFSISISISHLSALGEDMHHILNWEKITIHLLLILNSVVIGVEFGG